jgi:hypothetical protein
MTTLMMLAAQMTAFLSNKAHLILPLPSPVNGITFSPSFFQKLFFIHDNTGQSILQTMLPPWKIICNTSNKHRFKTERSGLLWISSDISWHVAGQRYGITCSLCNFLNFLTQVQEGLLQSQHHLALFISTNSDTLLGGFCLF